jgi:hypothetical protein
MDRGRYLPATRVKAGGLRLGRLSVRARTGREIGKLLGFVVDMHAHQICGLIVESAETQLVVSMSPMQFDPLSRSLRLVQSDVPTAEFRPDSLPMVSDEDLWVPIFNAA